MSSLFDHLVAIVVGAVLVGTLLFVQMRRQESAVETTVRNRVESQTDEFLLALQRDVENMRTVAQTRAAFGFDRFTIRRATDPAGAGYTSQFSFPTIAEPARRAASPVAIVSYEMAPTGQSVRVGSTMRRTYTITRYEYRRGRTVQRTGGATGILEFNVIALLQDGTEQATGITGRSDVARQVRVAVVAASGIGDRRTGDQRTTTSQNAVRRAATVRVVSATATEGLPPLDPGTAVVPVFPGDPPIVSPTPTTPSLPGLPTGSPTAPPPPTGGGGGGGAPPPPPPPLPGGGLPI